MLNQIFEQLRYNNSYDITPLKLKDFKKQATKAGYIIGDGFFKNSDGKTIRGQKYDIDKMEKLQCTAILKLDENAKYRIL